MTAPVFVDSNVLLYWRDASEPAKQARASEWLSVLWRERTGRISVQVLSEYYANATRKMRPRLSADAAWDDVRALTAWRPQPIDVDVLERSREVERRYRLSWWDSLIVGAAQAQRCGVLLSEDFQDGMLLGELTVRNPFLLKAEEMHGTYAAPVAPTSRHPGRGRPKRKPAASVARAIHAGSPRPT
jgi:predicted nucleic acid-binding protein